MMARWKPLLGAVLILVLGGLLAFEHGADASPAPMAEPAPSVALAQTAAPAAVPNASAGDDVPRISAEAAADLFATKSWYVPPPPPPPPKPVAPPFPYTLTGSQRDGETITALFVTLGERNFIVMQGDTLGGSYRLDEITAERAVFTYLPLQQQQTLQIGNTQ